MSSPVEKENTQIFCVSEQEGKLLCDIRLCLWAGVCAIRQDIKEQRVKKQRREGERR